MPLSQMALGKFYFTEQRPMAFYYQSRIKANPK
jgi:hypothetical protein